MFQKIVVPLDGSRCAERAIPVAARLARASGGSIVFVRVVLPPVELGKYAKQRMAIWEQRAYETQRAEAARYLAGMMITHANDLVGIDIDMGVTSGIIPAAICAVTRSEHADLIVMSSHGETGLSRWFYSSVAQEVSRRSPVPVLVLHERGGRFYGPRAYRPLRAIVALDGSALAETAILPAAQFIASLAEPGEGELHLLYVVDLPETEGRWRSQAHIDAAMREQARQKAETYLKTVADRHKGSLATAISWSVVLSDDAAGTIIQQAEECDLIVLAINGVRGRRGLQRLVKGSVAKHVFGATRRPLLLVRPQETIIQSQV
jgi:nucleotide-binding universal stress UspA family protein